MTGTAALREGGPPADRYRAAGTQPVLRPIAWATLAFVALAVLAGGGGPASPAATMIVEAGAALLFGAWALTAQAPLLADRERRRTSVCLAFLGAVLLLPMLQLVPLPAGFVDALPGRELARLIRAEAGGGAASLPMTLDPERTVASWLAMLPAAATFLAVLVLDRRERLAVVGMVVLLAAADAVLGVLQFASRGSDALLLYDTPHKLAAVGFFANRNQNADFLLIAPMFAAAALRSLRGGLGRHRVTLSLGLLAFFVLSVIAAASRMGLLLLTLAVPITLLLTVRGLTTRHVAIAALGSAAIGLALAAFAFTNDRVASVFARFATTSDTRFEFWPDVVYVLGLYWPWGSGIGTFDPVFRAIEQVDIVTPYFVNHAHNDYLELVIEAGAAGMLVIVAAAALVAYFAIVHLRRALAREGDAMAIAALGAIGVVLLHSLVEYPLRSLSLSTLFGLAAALLLSPRIRSVQ